LSRFALLFKILMKALVGERFWNRFKWKLRPFHQPCENRLEIGIHNAEARGAGMAVVQETIPICEVKQPGTKPLESFSDATAWETVVRRRSILGWKWPTANLQIVDTTVAPASAYLGILGVTGLTAWVGLSHIAGLKIGETIFVSGGAGGVGNAACQLARIHGCRVIASPGSEEIVSFLRNELKIEYAFNYRDGKPLEHLKRAAPDGIHVYFDNTGGPQLESALSALRNYGRIAMCGGIAGYNTPVPGPRNLTIVIGKRLRVEGFTVSDHFREVPAFLEEVIPALKSGKIINHETVVEGLDAALVTILDLFTPAPGTSER